MSANDNYKPAPEQVRAYYHLEKERFRDEMLRIWNIQFAIKLGIIKP